jgi:hypothetical protein
MPRQSPIHRFAYLVAQGAISASVLVLFANSNAQQTAIKYTTAYITAVKAEFVDIAEPDQKMLDDKQAYEARIPNLVRRGLYKRGIQLVDAKDVPPPIENGPANQKSQQRTLALNINVKYNPGNQALRWLAGPFGAGKATVHLIMKATDPATGNLVHDVDTVDTKRMGGLGGNFFEFADDVISDSIAEMIDEIVEVSKNSKQLPQKSPSTNVEVQQQPNPQIVPLSSSATIVPGATQAGGNGAVQPQASAGQPQSATVSDVQRSSQAPDVSSPIEQRLRQLEDLHKKKLVTDDEYRQARKTILSSF